MKGIKTMTSDEEREQTFYACKSCGALLLQENMESLIDYDCPRCQKSQFEKIDNFIMKCPVCFEYWPTRVIQILTQQEICHCPRPGCSGILTLQYQEEEKPPNNKLSAMFSYQLKDALQSQQIHQTSNKVESFSDKLAEENKEKVQKAPSSITPQSLTFENILPLTDLTSLISKPTLNSSDLTRYFDNLNLHEESAKICFKIEDLDRIFTSLLVLQGNNSLIERNSANNVTYIGNLNGSFQYFVQLVDYIYKILLIYPNDVFVFLGGYFNHSWLDLVILGWLGCLKIKFPTNIVLLRSNQEFPDIYTKEPRFPEMAKNYLASLPEAPTEPSLEIQSKIGSIFSQLLGVMSYLPLFHIITMNQGRIHIFGTNAAFPLDPNTRTLFPLVEIIKTNSLPLTKFNLLPDYLDFALSATPGEMFMENMPMFTKEEYFKFLKANSLRYMVRSHEEWTPQFIFQDLICTIYSSNADPTDPQINIPDQASLQPSTPDHKPSIVRLKAGKSPVVIELGDALTRDLSETYGIDASKNLN
jgi:DNA-directed RNA polymerase subunit RPC12/RpoP